MTSKHLKNKIIDFLGKESYKDGKLNRQFIAKEIFNDTEKLKSFNAIVHPAVHSDFELWKANLESKNNIIVYMKLPFSLNQIDKNLRLHPIGDGS